LQDVEQDTVLRNAITKPPGVETGSVDARPPTEP
jgi:hypothetical protein